MPVLLTWAQEASSPALFDYAPRGPFVAPLALRFTAITLPQSGPGKIPTTRIAARLLGPEWMDWFGSLTITADEGGETLLTVPVIDQAALCGLLKKVRDLGSPLLAVNRVASLHAAGGEFPQTHPKHSKGDSDGHRQNDIWNGRYESKASDIMDLHPVQHDLCGYFFLYVSGISEARRGRGTQITPVFLLIAAVVTEIPIAMVFLSRLLKYRANRWINIVGGVVMILWVIGGGSIL